MGGDRKARKPSSLVFNTAWHFNLRGRSKSRTVWGMSTVISNNETANIVADNLRRLLAEHEMSLRELARLTGDPHTSIASILTGKHVAGLGLMARIAEVFGVSVDYFVKAPNATPAKKFAKSR